MSSPDTGEMVMVLLPEAKIITTPTDSNSRLEVTVGRRGKTLLEETNTGAVRVPKRKQGS